MLCNLKKGSANKRQNIDEGIIGGDQEFRKREKESVGGTKGRGHERDRLMKEARNPFFFFFFLAFRSFISSLGNVHCV